MATFIANSGIQFYVTPEIEFKPDEPLVLPSGKTLKYTFVETVDYLHNCRVSFDVCSMKDGDYVPVSYLRKNELLQDNPNGTTALDPFGVPKMKDSVATKVIESYPTGDPNLISINSLGSYRVRLPEDKTQIVPAFELLQNTWLPMPMFEVEAGGNSSSYPHGWCRVKIEKTVENLRTNTHKYRLIWAFDTRLADDMSKAVLRPFFFEGDGEQKTYALCNRADTMFEFLSIGDGDSESAISDYIAAKLGLNLEEIEQHKYKFIGYYIYLCNFLRLKEGAAPEVTLFHNREKEIPVDLSVDIGNSRTCAILFEEGKFTQARELTLRNLSQPDKTYQDSFDMRVVFRKADFGNDLIMGDNLFSWPSLMRVGEEAKLLMYQSQENKGLAMRTTNYSSPKRYLWDKELFDGKWEFLVAEGDPTNVELNKQIYVEGVTNHFTPTGEFSDQPIPFSLDALGSSCRYSRSSLMTFVMMELLQQAICDINSERYRDKWKSINCRRYLRNIIITCPTAMPNKEQVTLRESALNAFKLLQMQNPTLHDITVTPDPEMLRVTDDLEWEKRGWCYDEAFANQLVYLYSEISERYNGENDKVIEMKGHSRPEHRQEGYERKSLTIGSIDIGAGTTDVMITAYQYHGTGQSRLTPDPLFWDSFYLAGDDMMKTIVQNLVIEGPVLGDPSLGGIYGAIEARLLQMTDEQIAQMPIFSRDDMRVYQQNLNDIRRSLDKTQRDDNLRKLATELVHGYFGANSSLMGVNDRICRNDFNTQISVHIAQRYLQMLSEKRPAETLSFERMFGNHRPAQYLLDHFARHFGFRFEELSWRFDPQQTGYCVRTTLEPLMKLLSVVLEAYDCDIIVLSGRPCALDDVSELFIKYYPVSPDRLIRMKKGYQMGKWYPLVSPQGEFVSPKSVVAVGAMVGYMASTNGFPGMELDFKKVIKNMKSTAKYIGIYNSRNQEVSQVLLTPQQNTATLKRERFPVFLGCKQFSAPNYSARPLFAIFNDSPSRGLSIMLQRNYVQNREELEIIDVTDNDGNDVNPKQVRLVQQSLADDGLYWLDRGEFELKLKKTI